MFGFSIFQVAVAVGKDLQTILISRFFGGLFGACPLAVVAAVFSDMFDNKSRGLAITVVSTNISPDFYISRLIIVIFSSRWECLRGR